MPVQSPSVAPIPAEYASLFTPSARRASSAHHVALHRATHASNAAREARRKVPLAEHDDAASAADAIMRDDPVAPASAPAAADEAAATIRAAKAARDEAVRTAVALADAVRVDLAEITAAVAAAVAEKTDDLLARIDELANDLTSLGDLRDLLGQLDEDKLSGSARRFEPPDAAARRRKRKDAPEVEALRKVISPPERVRRIAGGHNVPTMSQRAALNAKNEENIA